MHRAVTTLALVAALSTAALAQVGDLLWEDTFTDLDNWIVQTGNGSWGWGNGELEYYSPSNVDIAAVPGEAGNTALRITARQESGPGITDQWGYKVVDDKYEVHDLHATMLHLMGLDHEKLTYRFSGRDMSLTDVHGRLIKPILA